MKDRKPSSVVERSGTVWTEAASSKDTNRHGDLVPRRAGRFSGVADMLRKGDSARGFAHAAELCLDKFEVLSKQIPPYALLKLVIEMHKHALFCEISQDKTRTQHDTAAYAAFQEYLAGNTDIPVATGLPTTVASTEMAPVDVDDEGDSDGEEVEDE